MKSHYDVVILGAGHNGLVAAAYLLGARSSNPPWRRMITSGVTTLQRVFSDYDARLLHS